MSIAHILYFITKKIKSDQLVRWYWSEFQRYRHIVQLVFILMATALLCSFLSSAWMLWAYLLIYDRKHNNFQQSKSISFNLIVKKQLRSILAQLNENKFVIERAFKKIDKNLYPNFQQFRYHSFDGRTASLIFQLGYAHFSAQLEFNELIFGYVLGNMLIKLYKKIQHFKLISFNRNGERASSLITQLSLLEMCLLEIKLLEQAILYQTS